MSPHFAAERTADPLFKQNRSICLRAGSMSRPSAIEATDLDGS